MKNKLIIALEAAKAAAQVGVDYSPKFGATCPVCRTSAMRVTTTRPWSGDTRVRYHTCRNKGCPLNAIGATVKSTEVNTVTDAPENLAGPIWTM